MESNIARIAPLIERLAKPLGPIQLKLSSIGLYQLPDKYLEDGKINEFDYSLHFMDYTLQKGIVHERKLTLEEQWLEEQAGQKKGKKKKDQEPTPEEKKKMEEFAEIKRLDNERLEAMPEEEREYDIAEDNLKNWFIEFEKDLTPEEEQQALEEANNDQKSDRNEDENPVVENPKETYKFDLVSQQ